MAEEHDQHRDYRSGPFTGFNKEWYDKLRVTPAPRADGTKTIKLI